MGTNIRRLLFICILAPLVLSACSIPAGPDTSGAPGTTPAQEAYGPAAFTPQQIRSAYGVTSLIEHGITGKGQTVVVIVSYGSPTLQRDLDEFSQRFNLPRVTVDIRAPIGEVPFDPSNSEMTGWAGETSLDVETIHAIAPDAGIVVLTSPVDETEGTAGLPEFRQLEEYAVQNHLGTIISQSWGASEVSLDTPAGRDEIRQWDTFYRDATTQENITFVTGSGDNGVTDYKNVDQQISTTPTTSFPSDEPWVLSVGGTRLTANAPGTSFKETAWNGSGGGFSIFDSIPSYQQSLPGSVQSKLQGHRGVPDVAASADPETGMVIDVGGQFQVIGGTSASAPLWAGLTALADQMAGHSLGFLNPALYKIGQSNAARDDYHDITRGNNTYDQGDVHIPGYAAGTGWDLVTGWGSPDAEKLLPALIKAAGQL
ncbi:MAG: S53 family peptidase [Ktedonobacterales bacterium]